MDIEFKNPSAVFYSGYPVEGHVQLELPEKSKIRDIDLKFVGRVRTCRTRNHDSDDVKGETEYFDIRVTLPTSDTMKNEQGDAFPAGVHVFPFIFDLPGDLPPSFESKFSSIRYFVKASVHRKMEFDQTVKSHFTVIPLGILDLRTQQNAMLPAQVQGENVVKKLGFIKKGTYKVTAAINKQGYVPGETIHVSLDIDNTQSRATIVGCVVYLIMGITYSYDNTNFKETDRYEVASHEIDAKVEPGESDKWNSKLRIPGLTPSTRDLCDLIKVFHYIKIVFKNRHSLFNFKLPHLGVDIGTVPTKLPPPDDSKKQMEPAAEASTVHTTPPSDESVKQTKSDAESTTVPATQPPNESEKQLMSAAESASSSDIPSPSSYEECIIQASITRDEVDILPVYPYYIFRKPIPNQLPLW